MGSADTSLPAWQKQLLKPFREVSKSPDFMEQARLMRSRAWLAEKQPEMPTGGWPELIEGGLSSGCLSIMNRYDLPYQLGFFVEKYLLTGEEDYNLIAPPAILKETTFAPGIATMPVKLTLDLLIPAPQSAVIEYIKEVWPEIEKDQKELHGYLYKQRRARPRFKRDEALVSDKASMTEQEVADVHTGGDIEVAKKAMERKRKKRRD
jgi:hypothetical protein